MIAFFMPPLHFSNLKRRALKGNAMHKTKIDDFLFSYFVRVWLSGGSEQNSYQIRNVFRSFYECGHDHKTSIRYGSELELL